MQPRSLCVFALLLGLTLKAGDTYAPPLPSPLSSALPTLPPPLPLPIIEAEAGTGDWEQFIEAGETVIRAVQGKGMTYRVHFPEPGVYYVHLRCRLTSGMRGPDGRILPNESTNDALLLVGGVRLHGSDLTTRPEGLRCHHASLNWSSLPKGPGGHTPVSIKNSPVRTFLPQAGEYEVCLSYRSPGFVVDKIAFTRTPKPPGE